MFEIPARWLPHAVEELASRDPRIAVTYERAPYDPLDIGTSWWVVMHPHARPDLRDSTLVAAGSTRQSRQAELDQAHAQWVAYCDDPAHRIPR